MSGANKLPITPKDIAEKFIEDLKDRKELDKWVRNYKPSTQDSYFGEVESIAYRLATGSKVVEVSGSITE